MSVVSAILDSIQEAEGGYWDDPWGGPTQFGITQRTLDNLHKMYGSELNALPSDVKDLTHEEARLIIEMYYVRRNRTHELPAPLNMLVSHGVVMAWDDIIKIMQNALGVKADGLIGPKTLAAANKLSALELLTLTHRVVLEFLRTRRSVLQQSYDNRFAKALKYTK